MEGATEAVDVKRENKQMLDLMNVVIAEREHKQQHSFKKRDLKFKDKKVLQKHGGSDGPKEKGGLQGPSLVESIFRPMPDAFKG